MVTEREGNVLMNTVTTTTRENINYYIVIVNYIMYLKYKQKYKSNFHSIEL